MFKWLCLALAVIFLSVLIWMANDMRQGLGDLRQEIHRLKPTLVLEGEQETSMSNGEAEQLLWIPFNPRFASTPLLTFPQGHIGWEIRELKANAFSMQRTGSSSRDKLKWKAERQPEKSNIEIQSEAIVQELQGIQKASYETNRSLVRELQEFRKDMKKLAEGQAKK